MKFPLFDMKKSLIAPQMMLLACILTLSSLAAAQKTSGEIVMAPAAESLTQCANGGRGTPELPCAGDNWQFGNLGQNSSQWIEGEFVPYRALITNLVPGSTGHTLTIEFSTTQNGKHAIDYLGTWDQSTVAPNGPGGADACSGPAGTISPCVAGTGALIPVDPNVANNSNPDVIMPADGMFKIWNGNITGVSGYTVIGTYADTSDTTITITYEATAENVVITFGGHVATRIDWGIAGSAISISGSPYHTSIGGGDRSMSVDGAIFPAVLVVIKEVSTFGAPPGTTATFGFNFTYTPTGGSAFPFILTDEVVGPGGGGMTIPTLDPETTEVISIQNFASVGALVTGSLVEATYPQWTLSGITCVEQDGGLGTTADTTVNVAAKTANITAQEGEVITCTYANTQFTPTAAPASISGRTVNSFGQGIGNTRVTVMNAQTGETFYAITNPFGYYTIEGPEVGNFYIMTVSNKRYTFADDTRTFTLNDNIAGMDFIANP